MKKTVRFLPLLLAVLLLLPTMLGSCAGKYGGREDEVRDILRPLLDKEIDLLGYLYGDSFETAAEVDPKDAAYTTTAIYYRVSEDAPYHSVAELTEAAAAVYSRSRMEVIQASLFENGEQTFSRFCDYKGYADLSETIEIVDLQIDVTRNSTIYELTTVIDLSTLKVTRSTSSIIECTVDCSSDASERVDDMRIKLLYQEGVWKLDNQTWAKAYTG